jgi:WD40 repeat protein
VVLLITFHQLTKRSRFFITGGSEGLVSVCSLADGVSYGTFSSYTEEIKFAKPSWDGEYLAVGGGNNSVDIVSNRFSLQVEA